MHYCSTLGYCGDNKNYKKGGTDCTSARPPCTQQGWGSDMEFIPGVYNYAWTRTYSGCSWSGCWFYISVPTLVCSQTRCYGPMCGSKLGKLSAGDDGDGDGEGRVVLSENITDTEKAEMRAGCTLFKESDEQVLPEWAAQVNESATVMKTICAALDVEGAGITALSATATGNRVTELEAKNEKLTIALAVVATLLAVSLILVLTTPTRPELRTAATDDNNDDQVDDFNSIGQNCYKNDEVLRQQSVTEI